VETPRRMSKLYLGAVCLAVTVSAVAEAARYELGKPFPMSCVGILDSKAGGYFLTTEGRSDDDRICHYATIAEESTAKHALKYTLREKTVIQVLRVCTLGKPCRIEGLMNGLTHDVYFWVRVDSVTAPK
jgi:hypothetical protein